MIKSLVITNRNGEVVFEKYNFYTNDAHAGWNGLYRGNRLPAGVFIYTLGFEKPGHGFQFIKADVALIR